MCNNEMKKKKNLQEKKTDAITQLVAVGCREVVVVANYLAE